MKLKGAVEIFCPPFMERGMSGKFLFHPKPYLEESLYSYLYRVAKKNFIELANVIQELGISSNLNNRNDVNAIVDDNIIKNIFVW